jgi:hypothetical protein
MRLAQKQVWPALRYFEAIAPLPPQGQAPDRHLDIEVVRRISGTQNGQGRLFPSQWVLTQSALIPEKMAA